MAGSFGGNVTIGLVSNGAGTSGFGDAALTDKLVALSGKVYTQAAGQVSTPVIDFGIVRVGDVVSTRNITINNSAAVRPQAPALQIAEGFRSFPGLIPANLDSSDATS